MAAVGANGCPCDFCTGKKSWDDNWCPHCGEVIMPAPKWYENLDVCDKCEAQMATETASRNANE